MLLTLAEVLIGLCLFTSDLVHESNKGESEAFVLGLFSF